MDIGVVSARYAKALLKYAEKSGQLEAVYEGMVTLRDSLLKFSELKSTLCDPVLDQEKKLHLLMVASGNQDIECLKRFFELVMKKNRLDMILFISQSFIDVYRDMKNVILCQLTVPTKLNKSTLDRIKSVVENRTNKSVDFAVTVNPSIIGGFVLEYDSQCLDASVVGCLRKIRKQLAASC